MPDRNKIFQKGRAPTHPEVQSGPANSQTSFSRRGDARRSNLPFSGHIVNTFRRLTVLQLNIEGLTASKMNVLHHLAVQHEVFVILIQETLSISSEKLILTSFALAGFSLSRKRGLATFVHERLKCTFLKQSPLKSETECLCVDVDGYKIVNVSNLHRHDCKPLICRCILIPAFMLMILTALTILLSFTIQRILSAFLLAAVSVALSLIIRLLLLTWTAAYLTNVS